MYVSGKRVGKHLAGLGDDFQLRVFEEKEGAFSGTVTFHIERRTVEHGL